MLAEAILAQVPGLATSTASACLGKGIEGSHVLRAMGKSSAEAKSSMRFSLGRFTTADEIDEVGGMLSRMFR
jgi:cysteine desulfurase